MKKNFIKVSVICALTLASSATMVSCSDYDDDIKNHQEQIDALKKQLDASKTEITEGLNTAIEGLKAQIEEVAGSKADAASVQALEQKAAELQQALDSKASSDQIASLSTEVKGLIDDVNKELTAAMQDTKTSLEGQISTLETKQEELNKKLESLNGTSEQIASIQTELDKVSADLIEAQNQLKTITDAKYGEQIAELQTKITNLEGLKAEVESYTDEQIKTLDVTLTGKITAAINDVKALIPENLASRLATVEGKFANYVTSNELTELTDMIGDLSVLKGETLVAVLNGKADASELTAVTSRVQTLEDKFKEGGEIDEIKGDIETLRTDVKKMLGVMVQSIMYVRDYDVNGNERKVVFRTLYAHGLNVTTGNGTKIAENITDKVTFRVTPATAAEDFVKNYNISFEGRKIETRSPQNYLTATYNESESKLTEGLVTFDVTRNNNFGNQEAYVLCAHIVPKDGVEANQNNYTDVSSDFFYAGHKEDHINGITVESKLANGTHEIEWNDGEKSYDASQKNLIGTWRDAAGTVSTVVSDLEENYGNVFKVTYAMKHKNLTAPFPFQVGETTGIVKIADPTVSTTIGKEDYIVATATPNGTNFNYPTELSSIKFLSVKEMKKYEGQPITVNWSDVKDDAKTVDLNLEPIARAFEMQVSDLENIIKNSTKDDNADEFNTNGAGNVTVTYPNNGIKITIPKCAELSTSKNLVITLTDQTSSTTQSGSIYQITINISKTNYPEFALEKQAAVWNSNKTAVELTPTFIKDASKGNKISAMDLSVDVTSIYANYSSSESTIEGNNGYITITAPTNNSSNRVTGVSSVAYNSVSNNNSKMTITQSAYNGASIQATTKINLERESAGDHNLYTDNFTFDVQKLAGIFTNGGQNITFSNNEKNASKQLTGLIWKDYQNRVMWQNGKVQIYNATSNPNAAFAVSALSNSIYAMESSLPTYSIEQANEYLQVTQEGVVSLTQAGKDKAYTSDFTATLVVTIQKPRWGAIQGLENAEFSGNSYKLKYTITIKAGTY